MNRQCASSISPVRLIYTIKNNRNLIHILIKREFIGRYQGTVIGFLWSFFNPILMLSVYTFVFSEVFKARWVGGSGSKTEFAMILFVGLLLFNFFSECVNRAPNLIIGNPNYVKKVVFPLEIIALVMLGVALLHFLIGLFVWVIFYIFLFGLPPSTIFFLPIVILPLVLFTLGLTWFLASVGVYLRDISQVIGMLTIVLMFMSPIFYPVSALPEEYRELMLINPITAVVEQSRNIMVWNLPPSWQILTAQLGASCAIAVFGYAWFQLTRKGFADVV